MGNYQLKASEGRRGGVGTKREETMSRLKCQLGNGRGAVRGRSELNQNELAYPIVSLFGNRIFEVMSTSRYLLAHRIKCEDNTRWEKRVAARISRG